MNTSKQTNTSNSPLLKLSGSNFFRLKIAYSILLQKPVEISNIRSNSINPGLTEYEVSFLKLVERITNGTKIEISKTGTILKFYPGVITNNYGDILDFQCDNSRCLTYYLEGIIPISLYGKESLQIILKGVTNNDEDISVDTFKNVTCPLLAKCVIGDKVEFDIQKRGVLPLGNGQIKFKCPIITFLNNFEWADEGKIRRIRGVAFTCRVPGSFSTRMIDACRGVFNNFLPDVWIAVDNFKSKNKEEISQGYGLSIYGETTNQFVWSTDIINDKENAQDITPEDLARKCANIFLEEIYHCGAVDTHHLPLFLFLMAISTNHLVSKLKVGRLPKNIQGLLRFIYQLVGVKFKIEEFEEDDYDEELPEEEEQEDFDQDNSDDDFDNEKDDYKEYEDNLNHKSPEKYIFSCVGIGLKNVARIEG